MNYKLGISWEVYKTVYFITSHGGSYSGVMEIERENEVVKAEYLSGDSLDIVKKIKKEKEIDEEEVIGFFCINQVDPKKAKIEAIEGDISREEAIKILTDMGHKLSDLTYLAKGLFLKKSYFKDKEVRDFLEDIL